MRATISKLGFVRLGAMTELEQQVVELNCCPTCHAKTLVTRGEECGMKINQCVKCSHVWVLPSEETR